MREKLTFKASDKKSWVKKGSFAAVEAYKSTRTNLLFIGDGEGCEKIVLQALL